MNEEMDEPKAPIPRGVQRVVLEMALGPLRASADPQDIGFALLPESDLANRMGRERTDWLYDTRESVTRPQCRYPAHELVRLKMVIERMG